VEVYANKALQLTFTRQLVFALLYYVNDAEYKYIIALGAYMGIAGYFGIVELLYYSGKK